MTDSDVPLDEPLLLFRSSAKGPINVILDFHCGTALDLVDRPVFRPPS